VTVNYIGRLEDGRVFDTTMREVAESPLYPKAEVFEEKPVYRPLKFRIGSGEVIKGFEEAVIGMREGEEREVVIPAEKAYGERREDLVRTYPRVQKVKVLEEVPVDELSAATGLESFEKNATIHWRFWKARILLVTPESVLLKNEVRDTAVNTEVGLLEIKRVGEEIVMTLTPTLGERVSTKLGPAVVSFVNETEFTLDYNHPLAGKELRFQIKLESVEKGGG